MVFHFPTKCIIFEIYQHATALVVYEIRNCHLIINLGFFWLIQSLLWNYRIMLRLNIDFKGNCRIKEFLCT